MTTLATLAADLDALFDTCGHFSPVRLVVEASHVPAADGVEALAAAIGAHGPREGWLWGDGGPRRLSTGAALALPGRLFAAELALADGASLHVDHEDEGPGAPAGWRLVRYAEAAGEPTHLAERVVHVSTLKDGTGRFATGLVYRRYWRADAGGPASAVAARFLGFEGLEGV
ncbi:hypothetical protein ACTZWW_12240 [Salinarimonas sp. NSM]|uniref:hypothetical protein n=1 Tax=Salinarimonas sp. NSM TaxID=3458003 RepID=UPI0040355895